MKVPTFPAVILTTALMSAQTSPPKAKVFHPARKLASYEVATIKPFEPSASTVLFTGTTVRQYIRAAYAGRSILLSQAQVIGGPQWIDADRFTFNGKPPEELAAAMKSMKASERTEEEDEMKQSLLAERFHLKVHFEIRDLPVYELVPAKGGLKLAAAPLGDDGTDADSASSLRKDPLSRPGTLMSGMRDDGANFLKARAVTMDRVAATLSGSFGGLDGRPIVDRTGYTGTFDIKELKFAAIISANKAPPADAPSLATALEEQLGIKLVSAKAPVEVVVIDSIEHPTAN